MLILTVDKGPPSMASPDQSANTSVRTVKPCNEFDQIDYEVIAGLTEGLNTKDVRSDDKKRTWMQELLMKADQKVRRHRQHHLSTAERDRASAISRHLK
jgi:hypothetical protein